MSLRFAFTTAKPAPQIIKKFYKKATIEQAIQPQHPLHKWQIRLDGRTIKTPTKQTLAVPTPQLARMIAHEFNMQEDHLRPTTMPLLSMARTAVDIDFNNQLRNLFWNQALSFLEFDTVLFREDETHKLYKVQEEKLRPQIETFEKMFKVKLPTNFGFEAKQFKEEDKQKFDQFFTKLNSWELISIQQMGENLKSTILAILLHQNILDIETAVNLSRLEEQHCIETYGLVEGHHDVDENTVMMNTSAAKVFLQLIIEQNINY